MKKTMFKNKVFKKKTLIRSMFIALCLGAILFFVFAVTLVYRGSDSVLARGVERVLPLPAAIINWTHFVSIADLKRNLEATRNFYENQDFASIGVRIDFTTEDGRKKLKLWEATLLDKLIEDEVVYILADRAGIEITDAQVHARVKQELDRYGKGRVVQKNIRRLWGFTMKDFEERIVKPQIYREALEQYAQKHYDTTAMRQKALEAHTALDKGMDFVVAVKTYSESPEAAEDGGNAGWFSYDDLAPEIADKVFNLDVGAYSDVIETDNGFHIVKVEDRHTDTQGTKVLLRHIIIFKPTFAQWLDDQMRAFTVYIPLSAYTWNTETRHVDIADPDLKAYVEKLKQEAVTNLEKAGYQESTAETDSL